MKPKIWTAWMMALVAIAAAGCQDEAAEKPDDGMEGDGMEGDGMEGDGMDGDAMTGEGPSAMAAPGDDAAAADHHGAPQ